MSFSIFFFGNCRSWICLNLEIKSIAFIALKMKPLNSLCIITHSKMAASVSLSQYDLYTLLLTLVSATLKLSNLSGVRKQIPALYLASTQKSPYDTVNKFSQSMIKLIKFHQPAKAFLLSYMYTCLIFSYIGYHRFL